ncbi:hypothetical protein PPYR_14650 [Photinus pyralis]|uniref:Extended synaptotagmin-2 n=1 Tax=Photinus pyralis TaxID=7054 RepID=A0A5N4A5W4_PHOPY|nr:extended synaptotagmin-2-like isoform X1 [Photinus pyralis]XP_031356127.1 extended synaptotagmin-2-like isoform X1 [Photinus pyralis]KAB0792691.1 hypothetical protein PPYR_14650 [Photinus pyralis]
MSDPPDQAVDHGKDRLSKRKIAGIKIKSVLYSVVKRVASVLFVYAVGYMQWSFGWFFGPIVLLVIRDQYRKSKDQKSKITKSIALAQEDDVILARIEDLPAWVYFPDVERAEWLNKIFKQLWPSVNSYVRDLIRDKIQPKMQKKLQKFKLTGFKFEKMILGSIPPRVGGVKVYEANVARHEIILDLDLFYAGDCNLSFTMGAGVKGGIKDFQLQGTLRVVLKPLLSRMPLIGGLQIYFLNNPTIDFNLVGFVDILDLPGFSDLLRQLILEQVSSLMVLPNKLPVKLSKHVESEMLNVPEPEGVLRIHVIEAKNLMRKDIGILGKGKSDPYCVLNVGAQERRTQTIDNTVDPKWDYWCEAMVDSIEGQLVTIHVWDWDPGFPGSQNDDLLGRAAIDINTIAKKGEDDMWITLEQAKHGMVHVRFTWFVLTTNYSDLRAVLEETQMLQVTSMSTALLIIYVDSAKGLPQARTQSKPDPYLLLTVGRESQQTSVKKKTSDPVWEQGFNFLVNNPNADTLYLNFIDHKTGAGLGELTYNLCALSEKPNLCVNLQPFGLLKSGPQAKLTFSMHLRILKHYIPEAEDHVSKLKRNDSELSTGSKRTISRESSLKSETESNVQEGTESLEQISVPLQSAVPPESQGNGLTHRTLTDTFSAGEAGLGRIQITLRYSVQRQRLIVVIHKIANLPLPSKDPSNIPDPYVKLYLLPGRSKESKRKTQVVKDNCNPVFDVTFEYVLSQGELHTQQLEVTVATQKQLFSGSNTMGQVLIDLGKFNLTQSNTFWFDLQPEVES